MIFRFFNRNSYVCVEGERKKYYDILYQIVYGQKIALIFLFLMKKYIIPNFYLIK